MQHLLVIKRITETSKDASVTDNSVTPKAVVMTLEI